MKKHIEYAFEFPSDKGVVYDIRKLLGTAKFTTNMYSLYELDGVEYYVDWINKRVEIQKGE